MLWTMLSIIVAVISVIAGACEWFKSKDFKLGLLCLFGTALVGMIIAVIIYFFLYAVFCKTEEVETTNQICYIEGVESKNEQSSYIIGNSYRFILGVSSLQGGTSNSVKYYFFKVTDKGKMLASVLATDTYIKETNDEQPSYYEITTETRNTEFSQYLFGDLFNMVKSKKYILVVPENTIQIEYNIDI